MQGRVLSDGIEHTVLVDDACPDRGIAFWIPNSSIENGDVAELFDAIYRRGYAGTRGKVIRGRFAGTYSWDKKRTPQYLLKLARVEDLHIHLETEH